jgi:hypothetical protein
VSALAHQFESAGIASTVIALVRQQVEATRPPRALMVPFQLGRPLGEPNDVEFQHRVLGAALGLLTRTDGPVILEEFPDDPPGWFDRPDWRPSVTLSPPVEATAPATELLAAFARELDQVQPAWQRFLDRFGRTTVGLSGVETHDWPAFAAASLAGELPLTALHPTPSYALRFVADDIKACFAEAAQADGPPPSARQIDRWFWRDTAAGQLLIALRTASQHSTNTGVRTVGGRFLVPAPFVP